MTIWQYKDWITQPTSAERESRLRLHIQEVSEQMTPDVSKGNASKSTGGLGAYLQDLHQKLQQLEAANAPRVHFARLGRR